MLIRADSGAEWAVAMAETSKKSGKNGASASTSGRRLTAATRRLYQDLFSPEERAVLEGAVAGNDLDQEVGLLRVLIRRGVAEGVDLETLSRSLGRLAQMLRVRHVIRGDAAKNLDDALAKVLEEIANEVGL